MAVALNANGETDVSGAIATTITTFTVGSGSNRALLVLLFPNQGAGNGSAIGTCTVTWNGVSMTPLSFASITNSAQQMGILAFGLLAPASGNHNIVVTATGWGTGWSNYVCYADFTGVDQGSVAGSFPHQATGGPTTTTGAYTQAVTSATNNMPWVGFNQQGDGYNANNVTGSPNAATALTASGSFSSNSAFAVASGASTETFSVTGNGGSDTYISAGGDIVAVGQAGGTTAFDQRRRRPGHGPMRGPLARRGYVEVPSIPSAPLVWKRRQRYRPRKPLWRFFRPRHLRDTSPPALVRKLLPQALRVRRRRLWWRQRRKLFVSPAVLFAKRSRLFTRFHQSRPLWRFFRPKHVFGLGTPVRPASFLPRRYILKLRPRKPLWKFFRPKRLPDTSPRALVRKPRPPRFRPRRLRIFYRPRHLFVSPPPIVVFKPPRRLLRFRRPLWKLFRPKHLLAGQAAPLTGAGTYALAYVTRRLRIQFRPRHLFVPTAAPPPPVVVFKLRPRFRFRRPLWRFFKRRLPATIPAPLVRKPIPKWLPKRRSLWRFFRPKHLFGQRPTQTLVWKRPPRRAAQRKPLWRFFRSRHLFVLIAAPALVYRRPRRHRFSRPLWRFFRPKHLFGIGVAVQPSSLSWKRPPRGRARPRPLWRFFRPRHINAVWPSPLQVTGAGTYALPYVSRRLRIFYRRPQIGHLNAVWPPAPIPPIPPIPPPAPVATFEPNVPKFHDYWDFLSPVPTKGTPYQGDSDD